MNAGAAGTVAVLAITLLAPAPALAQQQARTTVMPPPAAASRDKARACMDSEDRVVALDHRNDGEKAAIQASTSTAARDGLLETWHRHEAEFQAALKAHTERCQRTHISAEDRAAIVKERAAAASSAR